MLLKYRRIDPQWHDQISDSKLYREGTECPAVDTPIGRFSFAIGGDLFNDTVAEKVQEQHPELSPHVLCTLLRQRPV